MGLYQSEHGAEMRTGRGKTLGCGFACVFECTVGQGCHVVTVNDYLAKRDADWIIKIANWVWKSGVC